MRVLATALPLLLVVAGPSFAQQVGDPVAGRALAVDICADCHAVDAGDVVSPDLRAPSFQSVARRPEISRLALTAFFQSPHPTMPNLVVAGEDAHNLIAYILSLNP